MTSRAFIPLLLAAALLCTRAALAQDMGIPELRALDPTLTGSGIVIDQPEADVSGTDSFEVSPTSVGQPSSKFTYISSTGVSSGTIDTVVGGESWHADAVGNDMYGDTNTSDPEGIAPGISHIYNYDADYFYENIVQTGVSTSAQIVNQSFVFTDGTAASVGHNQDYDNYAASHNTLFISGISLNTDPPASPGTSYNGIGVGAYGGLTTTGPNFDGRSKPDICAPESATSYATAFVTGAAAILLQAVDRGDAGTGDVMTSASDSRTLKALLLNGATKPTGWSHTDTAPLDPTYGAGIVNIYNSYENLVAGQHSYTTATAGAPSAINSGSIVPNEGWDLANITTGYSFETGIYTAESNHYLFDLSASTGSAFTLTTTLTWWRQNGQSTINNLDLYLFDASTGDTVALSDSSIDNVQDLYVQDLAPGEYDLVVEKLGGTDVNDGGNVVSSTEKYALAYNFAASAAPVPEPSTVLLLLVAPAAVLLERRRRR